MLIVSLLGIEVFIIFNVSKLKLFQGHLFSTTVKNNVIPIRCSILCTSKLCRPVSSILFFKITGIFLLKNVKLNIHIL